jgi:hypothetical protein
MVWEVAGRILGRYTGYTDWRFSWFYSGSQDLP